MITTLISNFLHLGQITILKKLFKEVHIPKAVYQEVEVYFSDNKEWRSCLEENFFVVHKLKNAFLVKQLLTHLHSGEAEALCLCIETKAKLCMIDDKDARIFAEMNNIFITGTLGILIQAKKAGFIESVKMFMDELKNNHHFWISDSMYKKVLLLSKES